MQHWASFTIILSSIILIFLLAVISVCYLGTDGVIVAAASTSITSIALKRNELEYKLRSILWRSRTSL